MPTAKFIGVQLYLKGTEMEPRHVWMALEHMSGNVLAQTDAYNRRIWFKAGTKWMKGAVLTASLAETGLTMTESNGHFLVRTEERPTNQFRADVNFFVFSRETGAGAYLQYHNSCGCMAFGGLLGRASVKKAATLLARAEWKKNNPGVTQKRLQKRFPIKGAEIRISYIMDPRTVDELVRALREVKSFTFTQSIGSREDTQDSWYAKGQALKPVYATKHEVRFKGGTSPGHIDIAGWLELARYNESIGRFLGKDDEGRTVSIAMADNAAAFWSGDLDDLMRKKKLISDTTFHESPVISDLVAAIRDSEIHFSS